VTPAVSKPLNGTLEVAGPGQFGLDELVRKALSFHNDPREVISDPDARYYHFVRLTERELLPGDDARTSKSDSRTGCLRTWHSSCPAVVASIESPLGHHGTPACRA
jgi:hypothetical protein